MQMLKLACKSKSLLLRISGGPDAPTLTVPIVGHLDLQAGQTSIPVELTVVPVGFAIAATHWPLVGLTALEPQEKKNWQCENGSWVNLVRVCARGAAGPTSMHRQLGWPFSLTAHSLPAPQNTFAHTLLLLCTSWKRGHTRPEFFQILHTWWCCSPATKPRKRTVTALIL